MKYKKEERLEIGRRIYEGEFTSSQAAERYEVSVETARKYMRLYRDTNGLDPKCARRRCPAPSFQKPPADMEMLEGMTREELIQEVIKARIAEARLKKGYEVKGDGTVILYDIRNIR